MKSKLFIYTAFLMTILVVSSCSLPRTAQHGAYDDDVYITRVETPVYEDTFSSNSESVANAYPDNQQDNYDNNYYDDPYYGLDYSTRLNNFYGTGLYRPYYNSDYYFGYYSNRFMPWYTYSPSLYMGIRWGNSWYNYDPWYSDFYYGYRYNPYFGLGYPYYIGGGYYGGGYYGGGYYGGIRYPIGSSAVNPNYGPRPNRGNDYINRNPMSGTNDGRPNRDVQTQGRPTNTIQTRPNTSTPQRGATANTNAPSRPSRETTTQSRPSGQSSAPASRPQVQQQRPSSSSSGNSGSSSSRGSSGGSSSSGRPTRGGN